MRKPIRFGWKAGLVWIPAFLLIAGCMDAAGSPPSTAPSAASPTPVVEATPSPPSSSPTPVIIADELAGEADLLAIGDIMSHSPQLPAYYDPKTQRYDFSPWFERVAPIFRQGDWVVGNLETPIAGAELKFTGYPRFNAPKELAEALAGAGVGLVSTANNHAMDRGVAGIERSLRNVRDAGLVPFGTASSPEDAARLTIAERGGIALGFASYTYGTNGIPVPADRAYAVNLIDAARIADDIRRLREGGADAVAVSLHFGVEYQRLPNDAQIQIVRQVVGAGADIVLGSHPHVVQPYDIVEVPAADSPLGEDRRGVVIYSLGNFISNQTNDWKDVGLIFGVHLTKIRHGDGTTTTTWDENVSLTPTYVHIATRNKKRYYTILPIRETLAQRSDPSLSKADYAKLEKLLTGIDKHLHTLVDRRGK